MYLLLSTKVIHSDCELIVLKFSFILRPMPLAEDIVTSRYRISSYSEKSVSINEIEYFDSLILSAGQLISPWPVNSIEQLARERLDAILELQPDVVLLGTGVRQHFPDARTFAVFGERGIGLEVMDNGALCRTFNILVAEDREVVAALIIGA